MEGRRDAGAAGYSLALSEQELLRYRMMAAIAADNEAAEWAAAGIVPGAGVADVGCGPGAVLRMLAERVGAAGQAVGVDADPGAVAVARQQTAGPPAGRGRGGRGGGGGPAGPTLRAWGLAGTTWSCAVTCLRTTAGARLPLSPTLPR